MGDGNKRHKHEMREGPRDMKVCTSTHKPQWDKNKYKERVNFKKGRKKQVSIYIHFPQREETSSDFKRQSYFHQLLHTSLLQPHLHTHCKDVNLYIQGEKQQFITWGTTLIIPFMRWTVSTLRKGVHIIHTRTHKTPSSWAWWSKRRVWCLKLQKE